MQGADDDWQIADDRRGDGPRLKGVPYLDLSTAVYAEDIEAWEAQAGVRLSAGDAIFLYTGRWA